MEVVLASGSSYPLFATAVVPKKINGWGNENILRHPKVVVQLLVATIEEPFGSILGV